MPLHDGVVAVARRFGGIALDDLDAQPAALRLRVQLRQHGRRQVQRHDAVTLTRQQQAQEPRPAPASSTRGPAEAAAACAKSPPTPPVPPASADRARANGRRSPRRGPSTRAPAARGRSLVTSSGLPSTTLTPDSSTWPPLTTYSGSRLRDRRPGAPHRGSGAARPRVATPPCAWPRSSSAPGRALALMNRLSIHCPATLLGPATTTNSEPVSTASGSIQTAKPAHLSALSDQ